MEGFRGDAFDADSARFIFRYGILRVEVPASRNDAGQVGVYGGRRHLLKAVNVDRKVSLKPLPMTCIRRIDKFYDLQPVRNSLCQNTTAKRKDTWQIDDRVTFDGVR